MAAMLIPLALARPRVTITLLELPPALEIAICAVLICGALCLVAIRPVREPSRALIYRMATLHRVAGPGYVWLVPFLDRIEHQISIVEHEAVILPTGVRTADNHLMKLRLEVTWRISPDVHGEPTDDVRLMLLLPEERRAKLVEEAITSAAVRTIATFALANLSSASNRDDALAMLGWRAGGDLERNGIQVVRVFWRL